MNRKTPRILRLAVLLTVLLGSCYTAGRIDHKIGRHVFRIPKNQLIKLDLPWLPAVKNQDFMYILNPGARPEDQITVLVKEQTALCRQSPAHSPENAGDSGSMLVTCGEYPLHVGENESDYINIRKTPGKGGDLLWRYESEDGRDLVSCSALVHHSSRGGLCSAIFMCGDLSCDLGFSEREIPRLNKIVLRAQQQLSSWEIFPPKGNR